jgi:hypothetical protein
MQKFMLNFALFGNITEIFIALKETENPSWPHDSIQQKIYVKMHM